MSKTVEQCLFDDIITEVPTYNIKREASLKKNSIVAVKEGKHLARDEFRRLLGVWCSVKSLSQEGV